MKSFKRNISRLSQTIKTLALVAVVAMTSSCEDFLTIYPTDKVVLEDFWKTKNDVQNMVANSYGMMTERSFLERLIVWGELRGDNVVEGTYASKHDALKQIMEANLLPQNGYTSWEQFYRIINNCNIVMKFAPEVINEDPDFTQGDLDVTMGEMLAIRALCHFYLVRTFRDIPLLKEAMVDDDQNLYQPQSTPLEAIDFILEDLYKAESLVMSSGNYPSDRDNKGRMTKNAVRAIIADVLLWKASFTEYETGDPASSKAIYTECITFCDSVLNNHMKYILDYEKENMIVSDGKQDNKYPLEHYPAKSTVNSSTLDRVYSALFYSGNNRRESILELQFGSNQDNGNYLPYFYGHTYKVGPLSAPRDMVETGSSKSIYKATDYRRISNIYIPDGKTDADKFPILKYSYRAASGTLDKPSYPSSNSLGVNTHKDNGDPFYGSSQNWILYRISDVMLMKAEALAYRNDTVGASNQDLKKSFELVEAVYYRSNPYIKVPADSLNRSASTSDAKTMQKLVLQERQRELAFEGKRWFDLVRKALRDGKTKEMLDIMLDVKYETGKDAIESKMSAMDCMFFPIQEREIKTNPLLTQNPAYETEDLYEKN